MDTVKAQAFIDDLTAVLNRAAETDAERVMLWTAVTMAAQLYGKVSQNVTSATPDRRPGREELIQIVGFSYDLGYDQIDDGQSPALNAILNTKDKDA